MTDEDGGIGICLSGGGIRSAAFNLGSLQVLQDKGVLQGASWLAAVSGGAYIAGAFTMVTKSIQDRQDELAAMAAAATDAATKAEALEDLAAYAQLPAFSPGSPEEAHLRNNSRYIAPRFRYDIEIVVRMLLGLLSNMIVIGVILAVVALPLGFAYGALARMLVDKTGVASHAVTSTLTDLTLSLLAAGVMVGLLTVAFRIDRLHTFYVRLGSVLFLGGAVFGLFTLLLPWLVLVLRQGIDLGFATLKPGSLAGATGAAGGSVVVAVGLQVKELATSVETVTSDAGTALAKFKKLSQRTRMFIVHTVGLLVVPLGAAATFVVLVAVGVHEVHWTRVPGQAPALRGSAHGPVVLTHPSVMGTGWLILAGTVALGLLLYGMGDLTNWSMHPYYRRRLASAYALERIAPANARERPYRDRVVLSAIQPTRDFPKLLVCAAANVTDKEITPPGMNAVSFVFSGENLGYRDLPRDGSWVDTKTYEQWIDAGLRNLGVNVTLPAAIAMSGAAISPAMGHMTRPWLRALMALGNIRLGVWVPNPRYLETWQGKSGFTAYRRTPGPPRVYHLLSELIGVNSVKRRYLYVSDGGHWENLGLVELLRRRCEAIWCFDAAGDNVGKYHTLGQALALAGAELRIEVEIDPTELRGKDSTLPANQCDKAVALGKIIYPDADPGLLVYVRAAVTPKDSWSTLAYADTDSAFPGDPTLEQLYDYARFDAYHALGRAAATEAFEAVEEFRRNVAWPPPGTPTPGTPPPGTPPPGTPPTVPSPAPPGGPTVAADSTIS